MAENQENIYQAPMSDLSVTEGGGVSNFKRFSAWGVFGLSIITLGIYPAYWLYNRAKVLNSFHENRMSIVLLNSFIITVIASFSMGFISGAIPDNTVLAIANSVISIAYIVIYLVVLYKLRSRLRDVIGCEIGPVLTFFASAIYLQYKINESIDAQED